MPSVRHTTAQYPLLHHSSFRSTLLAKLTSFSLAIFVTITILAVFVPLNPDMPHTGLDKSWAFATNEAVARHLSFGKDFIFTFGPYASIYTQSYHPETDRLMVVGSFLLGVSYVISLLYLSGGRKPQIILILTLFCATFRSRDALLLSCPFILVVCALKYVNSEHFQHKAKLSWQEILFVFISCSALGLLPLIKGSLLIPAGISTLILGFLLLIHIPFKQAFPLLLIPFASTVFFWIFAGQSLSDIPSFLHGTWLLISGYTEAMSLSSLNDWRPKAIVYGFLVTYTVALVVIAWTVFSSTRLTVSSKWLIGFLCATFLWIAFKHGFVRAGNERIAFDTLFICTLMISLLQFNRLLLGLLVLVLALVLVIYVRQDPQLKTEVKQSFGVGTVTNETGHLSNILAFISKGIARTSARITYESTWNTYSAAGQGLRIRLTQSKGLQDRFASALAEIRSEYSVPSLRGTADVYTNEQSVLLASGNQWKPRPIIQSYAAYTPDLARINEQRLRTSIAPDWVLVNLTAATSLMGIDGTTAIDGRLPSLEDGLSWPALLENYTFNSFDGQFVFLHRNPVIETNSNWDVIYTRTYKTGEAVALPEADGPLFAEIDLKPTLLGRALIALFKPPMVNIVLSLRNGVTKNYRVISNMMVTGFILSPLVSSTSDFASLSIGDRRFHDEGEVRSISIAPAYGNSLFWSGTYVLTLKTHKAPLQ